MEQQQIQSLTTSNISSHRVSDHFADVGKMVDLGKGFRLLNIRRFRNSATLSHYLSWSRQVERLNTTQELGYDAIR